MTRAFSSTRSFYFHLLATQHCQGYMGPLLPLSVARKLWRRATNYSHYVTEYHQTIRPGAIVDRRLSSARP